MAASIPRMTLSKKMPDLNSMVKSSMVANMGMIRAETVFVVKAELFVSSYAGFTAVIRIPNSIVMQRTRYACTSTIGFLDLKS